ncbi:MAG TPA: hypothetical protein VKU40_17515 [Thermoanaerobaculia bacterium]|nr:hypothetical protein [Thermoanaerobaculia bacterium]
MRTVVIAFAFLAAALVVACAGPPAPAPVPATAADTEPGAAEEPRWRWTDYEIVGQRELTREEVASHLPDLLGQPYEADREMVGACGEALEAALDVAEASCSWVTFFTGEAYLLAEIVERGEEWRTETPAAPEGQVELATPELVATYEALKEQLWANYRNGVEMGENSDAGHLDYREPQMHAYVETLHAELPEHRDNLLAVLAGDADAEDRAAAAWMLNWAGDLAGSAAAVAGSINDPNGLVRNDVSRFLIYALPHVDDRATLRALVDELAVQLARPSHGDRNKAIYSLKAVLEKAPDLAPYVEEKAGEWIDRVAAQSILSNVGGTAQEVRALLGEG